MKTALFVVSVLMFLFAVTPAHAARLLPRFSKTSTTKTTTTSTGSNISVSPKFMSGKTGVKVSFSNLSAAKSVSYTLSYDSSGKPEGVVGSVDPSKGSDTRELLFGTCSSGTCKYHKNIKNCILTVTSQLKNGKKSIKKFRLNV